MNSGGGVASSLKKMAKALAAGSELLFGSSKSVAKLPETDPKKQPSSTPLPCVLDLLEGEALSTGSGGSGSGSGGKKDPPTECLWCTGDLSPTAETENLKLPHEEKKCTPVFCSRNDQPYKDLIVACDVILHKVGRFKCYYCPDETFASHDELQKHYGKFHFRMTRLGIRCTCKAYFWNTDDMDDHKNRRDDRRCPLKAGESMNDFEDRVIGEERKAKLVKNELIKRGYWT
ncbi:hypothetical protein PHJA_001795400 [Phtheirospermum japonicum]|uniref:Uncharacterized protein n=1 Tax=Phtheirospermum japonicum TaxID=374723 RepID=A0A830CKZ9_9LAMI|nr:hypothetical protein PHJA_001795400 [Phtheirospermum japonicum]